MSAKALANPRRARQRKNFIIDIDGCVCEHVNNEEPERMAAAKPIPGARQQINMWFDQGHHVCFFTSRTDRHREVTERWLKKNGFKYHQIIFNKPRGGNYHYIDDRTVRATRFEGRFSDFVVKKKEIQVFE